VAAQGSDFAEAPDYDGNARLIEETMPPQARYDRMAITRTYHPKYLPRYVSERDKDGNVVRSAAEMYAAAIPKVTRAVGAALSPDLHVDFSMRFPIKSGGSMLRGHKFFRYGEYYQYGDLDPYDDPWQDPSNKDPPKSDPLKPIWNDPCNKYCPEAMYVIPVLHYTWTDEDGNKHQSSTPINPRTGQADDGSAAANKGKIKNNCLGLHKNVDNTARWNQILSAVGDGYCGDDAYNYGRCGAREGQLFHSDCVDTCISQGRATKFNGTKGPYFTDVKPMKGACGQTINAPTGVRYDLCWTVDQAKQQCIMSDTQEGVYGGLVFDFCSCHAIWIWQRYSNGAERNLDPTEEHELCIPYEIPISYDSNGCPYIPPNQSRPMPPTDGQNDGDWDPGDPDVHIDFELWPYSQIPKDWLDEDEENAQRLNYEIVAYGRSFSRSALYRFATGT